MNFTRKHLRYLLPLPIVVAAAWMLSSKPSPKVRRKQVLFDLTSTEKRLTRPVYPFSVVPGGVYDRVEASKAVKLDPVVAKHYGALGVDVNNLRTVTTSKSKQGYVSYRVGDRIYWTKKKVEIEPGEVVLTDGVHKIRGRCGNMISDKPQSPVLNVEPPAKKMNEPDPSLKPSLDSGEPDPGAPTPVMPKIALERDNGEEGSIHAYAAAGSESGSGTDSSSGGSFGAGAFSSAANGGGSGSGGGRAAGGAGGGASGGGASGGGGGSGAAANGEGSGSNTAGANGAGYAMAAANTISGSDKPNADLGLRETANGGAGNSWLSGILSSLSSSAGGDGSGSGAGLQAGNNGTNLLSSSAGGIGSSTGLNLAGGPAQVKVLSATGSEPSGSGKGVVHPFSADANYAAQLPPGNPSGSTGVTTQQDGSGPSSDTLAKRRDTTRPAGTGGTSADGSEAFNVRPTSEVPEPSTWLMMGAGLAAIGLKRRRAS